MYTTRSGRTIKKPEKWEPEEIPEDDFENEDYDDDFEEEDDDDDDDEDEEDDDDEEDEEDDDDVGSLKDFIVDDEKEEY